MAYFIYAFHLLVSIMGAEIYPFCKNSTSNIGFYVAVSNQLWRQKLIPFAQTHFTNWVYVIITDSVQIELYFAQTKKEDCHIFMQPLHEEQ